jgi:adenylate kinase family enzyme
MIVIIGRAGVGKTVQGKKLAEVLGCPWVSVGDIIRRRVSGEMFNRMLEGKMLNDQKVLDLLLEELKHVGGLTGQSVLDGFPRTFFQTDWFIDRVKDKTFKVDVVIHLLVPVEVAKERLVKRARQDDHESAIAERFSEYDQTIDSILDRMHGAGLTIQEINGDDDVESVHKTILNAVK